MMPARCLPLGWRDVTEGSRIVLPSYPTVFCAVGLILIIQSPQRTASPAFDSARWVFSWTGVDPVVVWGCIFLAIGLAETASGILGRRWPFVWLLVVAAGVCAFWSTLLFCSGLNSPLVSFTGGVWVAHSAWCHIASVRSLTRDLVLTR